MHIANALNVPMIALFGPTFMAKNGPRSKKARIIKADMDCVPCQDAPAFWSCEKYRCMESITAGDVMHEVRRFARHGRWQ